MTSLSITFSVTSRGSSHPNILGVHYSLSVNSTRYRDSRYLLFLRQVKGRFCFVIDSLDSFHRWFFQQISAREKVPIDESKCLHILCIKRSDYVYPAINCINSFWQFHPEYRVKIWCDSSRKEILEKNLKKFHRKDRINFQTISPAASWQEDKLRIICKELLPLHLFSDADMFWNGRINIDNTPLLFLREYDFEEYSATKFLKSFLDLDSEKTWYMLNVSVVNLGSLSQDAQLVERATELFSKIMKIERVSVLGRKEITQLKRTSEQLAISIALQERGSYKFLKAKDGVMDGGLAESFYLGATQGF